MSVDSLEHQAGIGPAKAEAVVEYRLDLALLGDVRDEVDALGVLVGMVEIDRRRDDLVAHRQDAENRLDCAGAAEQMPAEQTALPDEHRSGCAAVAVSRRESP